MVGLHATWSTWLRVYGSKKHRFDDRDGTVLLFFRPPSWCSFHRCYYYCYFHPRFREIENWSLERIEFFDQEKWLNFLRILSFVEEIWLSTLWYYEVKKHAFYSSWRLITRFDKGFHISRKLIDKNNSSVDARASNQSCRTPPIRQFNPWKKLNVSHGNFYHINIDASFLYACHFFQVTSPDYKQRKRKRRRREKIHRQ